jgi:predicted  nucleic acid-binding Zn-ribbon protein
VPELVEKTEVTLQEAEYNLTKFVSGLKFAAVMLESIAAVKKAKNEVADATERVAKLNAEESEAKARLVKLTGEVAQAEQRAKSAEARLERVRKDIEALKV